MNPLQDPSSEYANTRREMIRVIAEMLTMAAMEDYDKILGSLNIKCEIIQTHAEHSNIRRNLGIHCCCRSP